jgi:hypothetical protein
MLKFVMKGGKICVEGGRICAEGEGFVKNKITY